jgi:F-type H+-transporting ATPase subunit b
MLELNLNLFLYQLAVFVIFAVVVTVIYKLLLTPILRERRERIEGDMERAAQARADAAALKSKYEKKVAEVGDEASAIIKRVNEEAARHREELLSQARRQAEALIAKTEELISIEETQAARPGRGYGRGRRRPRAWGYADRRTRTRACREVRVRAGRPEYPGTKGRFLG